MKKIALVFAGIALLLAAGTSCKKDKKDTPSSKPSVSWEANSDFSKQEITTTMDANIAFTVPEGIRSFTLKFTTLPPDLLGVVKQHISTSANRTGNNDKTPILDAIEDNTSASYLIGLKMFTVSNLSGATAVVANFKALLDDLLKNQELSNNSTISILVSLVDKEDNKLERTVSFHYTSGPEFTWKGNANFDPVEINGGGAISAAIAVDVPGGIETAVIYVSTNSKALVSTLNKYVTTPTASGVSLDLIEDAQTVDRLATLFGIATGDKLKGKTSATIDLSKLAEFIKDDVVDAGNSDHKFDITIGDVNCKVKTCKVVFHYTPKQ